MVPRAVRQAIKQFMARWSRGDLAKYDEGCGYIAFEVIIWGSILFAVLLAVLFNSCS